MTSAAKEYGLTPERVFRILIDDGVIKEETHSLTRTYVSAEKCHGPLTAATMTMNSTEVREALGLTSVNLQQLIKEGLLGRVEVPSDGRVFTRIRKQDVMDFQSRLYSNVVEGEPSNHYRSLKGVARNYGLTFDKIVAMVLERRFKRPMARPGHSFMMEKIYLDTREAAAIYRSAISAVDDSKTKLLTIREVELRLRVPRRTITFLSKAGYLTAVEKHAFGFMDRQFFISEEALNNFVRTYVAVSEIARSFGTHSMVVSEELERLKKVPAFPTPTKVSQSYLRVGVADLNRKRRTPTRYRRK